MKIQNGGPSISHDQIVLFPFDDYSLPFQNGVELNLIGHTTPCGRTRVVLGLGPEGGSDCNRVVYYGSVHRVGDELYMWYLGQGTDDEWFERVHLAKSRDGLNWERPNLGLVEYNGNRNNNLVDLMGGEHHIQASVIFHDPDDTERRFKMIFESNKYNKMFGAAYSADGLTWHEYPNNPVGAWLEMAGGTKFDGCYYLTGQGGSHAGGMRQLVTYVSYDFEHWSSASALGLRRSNIPPRPVLTGGSVGEQVHLGAALWNRGNIILGFYGQWHGHPSNDRRLLTMDLGLAVTNDALHYREPIPDFAIVASAEDGFDIPPQGTTAVHFPALIQGQGFENVGDQTLFWYAPWPEQDSDGVRVATWTRDRSGFFRPLPARRLREGQTSHVVSAPIDLEGQAAKVWLNVDSLGEYTNVTAEVVDEQFNPLPGFSGEAASPNRTNGLRVPITWQGNDTISAPSGRIRLRLSFGGIRPEDARLFAIYIEYTD